MDDKITIHSEPYWIPPEREKTVKDEKRLRRNILNNAIILNDYLTSFIKRLSVDGLGYHKNEIEDDLEWMCFIFGIINEKASKICENYKL